MRRSRSDCRTRSAGSRTRRAKSRSFPARQRATVRFRQFEYFLPAPRRAMLGVNIGGAEPSGGGVRVDSVSPGGPAAEAGVKAGDVIVAIEAQPVTTGRELVRAMEAIEPGEKVELGLKRDGKPLKLAVEPRPLDRHVHRGHARLCRPCLQCRHCRASRRCRSTREMHWLLGGWGDAEFVTLTPRLGRYFGADKGVLVARAPEDASIGLQDGDVIVSIGGREPQNGPHAMRILRSYQPGESVELRILRDRRPQTLSAKVPERAAARRPAPGAPPRRRRPRCRLSACARFRRELSTAGAVLVCAAHAPRRLLLCAAAGTDRRPAAAAARREPAARARRCDGRDPRPRVSTTWAGC